jgi:hypothetical protein
MDTALAGSLVKLTVGGLGVDASFIEGDPVLKLMGVFSRSNCISTVG